MSRLVTIASSTALALVLWQALVTLAALPPFILPGPGRVAETLWASRALIAHHATITAAEVLIGLALGAILGGLSAIGLASSPMARRLIRPIMVFSQAIPVFALAPILTLWLGYGLWSKVAMALLIIYFPVTSAFFDALMRTPPQWLDLAAVYAPIGAIIGEWVGASKGLGYLMLLANGRAKIDLMFAALIVLAILTLLLHAGVDRGCRRWLDGKAVG